MNSIESRYRLRVNTAVGLLVAGVIFGGTFASNAAPFQLLSTRNPASPQPTGGNANSVTPTVSPDGRFVLFTSAANNLVPESNSLFSLNLFLRDRASNTTVLVSANINGTGGGNDNSINGMVSTNGRWVVFQSDATDLVPGDTNVFTDIFVRDLQTGSNTLVSVATNGGWGNGASTFPTMTPDGRYVAFFSDATNLVANDTNGIADVFVRDLVNHKTVLASVGAIKNPSVDLTAITPTGPPLMTPDGTKVAFFSNATNLVAGVPLASVGEVYVRDLVANRTLWASSNALTMANFPLTGATHVLSYHPSISDDGRFVTFKTSTSIGQSNAYVFEFDSNSSSLSLVASNCLPLMFNDDIYGPEMSSDGRFIAFVSGVATATLAPTSSVYVVDTQLGTNILASIRLDGALPTNSSSHTPVLSRDGRFVAFMSNATNLVSNVITNGFHIYLRDLVAGTTALVDSDTNGAGAFDEYGNAPGLSADDQWLAFASLDGALVAGNPGHGQDVFMRNITSGTNEMISVRDTTIASVSGDAPSTAAQVSITPNGRWVAFSSSADDLVTNDFNGNPDVFVTDLVGGTTTLESVGLDGNSVRGGGSSSPLISSNGQYLVFYSSATNVVPGYSTSFGDIFLRDRVAGTNTLVSLSTDGVSGGRGFSSAPAMSPDGRYVTFLSAAQNLVSPGTTGNGNTFWRDTALGVTLAVSSNSSATFSPSISADGRYVAYSYSPGSTVSVWDSQTLTNIYTAPAPVTSALISPDGGHLLYFGNNTIKVLDLTFKTNVLSTYSTASARSPAQWSADGRFVTFVARSNGLAGVFTNNQIYLADLQAGTVALVSDTPDHTTGGNGVSDSPVLSGNGRFVIYRSSALNIADGAVQGSSLIVYDRETGSNTLVNPSVTGLDWTTRASRPLMDAAGQTITFQSVQSTLAPGDINRVSDIFAGQLAVTLDSDGDGIPDWWMMKYFGHPTGQAGDNSLAQDDADGDGFTNLAEFLTGTDPTNPQSHLTLDISPPDPALQTVALTWTGVPGKSYQVQYRTNLTDPVWLNYGAAVVATPAISVTVPLNSTTSFYRLVAIN